MILVFGCRQSEIDHIYKEETIQAKNKNVFKELYTAYSREPGKPKVPTAFKCPSFNAACTNWSPGSSVLFIFMCDFVIFPLSPCQKYVQDALREQLSERVYQCLREEGGHIYVCGDVTMAGDVLKNVQQIIKQEGNMSLEEAGLFISKLRVRQMVAVLFIAEAVAPARQCECMARKYSEYFLRGKMTKQRLAFGQSC